MHFFLSFQKLLRHLCPQLYVWNTNKYVFSKFQTYLPIPLFVFPLPSIIPFSFVFLSILRFRSPDYRSSPRAVVPWPSSLFIFSRKNTFEFCLEENFIGYDFFYQSSVRKLESGPQKLCSYCCLLLFLSPFFLCIFPLSPSFFLFHLPSPLPLPPSPPSLQLPRYNALSSPPPPLPLAAIFQRCLSLAHRYGSCRRWKAKEPENGMVNALCTRWVAVNT